MSSRECPAYTPFTENIHWVASVEIGQRVLEADVFSKSPRIKEETHILDITIHTIPDGGAGIKKSFTLFLNGKQSVEFKGFTLNDPASR